MIRKQCGEKEATIATQSSLIAFWRARACPLVLSITHQTLHIGKHVHSRAYRKCKCTRGVYYMYAPHPCNLLSHLRLRLRLCRRGFVIEERRKSGNAKPKAVPRRASCRLNGRRLVEMALAFIRPRDSPPRHIRMNLHA